MPKRPFKDKDQDKYGEIKRLKKQFREMQEHLNKICDSSESSSEVFSTSGTFFFSFQLNEELSDNKEKFRQGYRAIFPERQENRAVFSCRPYII